MNFKYEASFFEIPVEMEGNPPSGNITALLQYQPELVIPFPLFNSVLLFIFGGFPLKGDIILAVNSILMQPWSFIYYSLNDFPLSLKALSGVLYEGVIPFP